MFTTRRDLGRLLAAACATQALPAPGQPAQPRDPSLFSVMLWTLQTRGTLEENLKRVADAGYRNVELVGEFEHWSEADWTRILAQLARLNLRVDATSGIKLGFADPANGPAFLAELKSFLPIAKRLGCRQIILLSGKRLPDATPGTQHAASIAHLREAAALLAAAGLTGVIEPIDRLENPTIYLDGVSEAFDIARAVGSPNLLVLYDLYHEQRGLGNLIEKLERNIDLVGLIHIADVPGRHEPGTGEIHFANIYRKLTALHYKGILAMEFYPTGDPVDTLRRAREEAS